MSTEILDRARVAELLVTHADGRRRGSGYRVTTDAVLTAAHLLEGAVSVHVRFEPDLPGEWTTTAVSWFADAASDIAVVTITPRPGEPAPPPARFGRIGTRAAQLPVQAVGFPRWKLRSDHGVPRAEGTANTGTGTTATWFRDSAHVVGSVAALSHWAEAIGPGPYSGGSGPPPRGRVEQGVRRPVRGEDDQLLLRDHPMGSPYIRGGGGAVLSRSTSRVGTSVVPCSVTS